LRVLLQIMIQCGCPGFGGANYQEVWKGHLALLGCVTAELVRGY
jgi:hypothetical protein